jgi:4-hydroxy-4-methyl-2-oxoglutarate aldolase
MFTLNSLPPQIDERLLKLLRQAEPATIGHFLHSGFVDPAVRAYFPEMRIAGTAVTISSPGPDAVIIHHALGQCRPGDVLVIDRCGDHKHACAGGAVAYAARKAGIIGIVVDGMVTDIGELRTYGVPVWARGLSTITQKKIGLGGGFCVPVSCGGVAVRPGDGVFADENGVLILDPADIEWAAQRAIALQQEEKKTLARIDAGEKIADIVGSTALIETALSPR